MEKKMNVFQEYEDKGKNLFDKLWENNTNINILKNKEYAICSR